MKVKDARQIEAEREKKAKDFYAQKKYDIAGNSIYLWLTSAKNLLCVCRLIEAQFKKDEPSSNCDNISFNVFNVDLMLRAYSLECFFKAIWLKKGNTLCENGEFKKNLNPKPPHDLFKLSQIVGISNFEKNEKDLLKKLSQFSLVYGRYPIPLSYKKNVRLDFPVHHIEVFKNIIKKLLKHFPSKKDYQSILNYISELIL